MICRFGKICLAILLCSLPAMAQDVPLPNANPETGLSGNQEPKTTLSEDSVAAPKPKPDIEETLSETAKPGATESVLEITAEEEKALALCEAELSALGAQFKRLEPIEGEGGCGVPAPYGLTLISPGVSLSPNTQMSCQTALATSKWVVHIVQPAASALGENVRLKSIVHASTYVCRKRNNQSAGKISEHSKGNAIDIASFNFENHGSIPVEPRAGKGTIAEAFQRTARAGACLYFSTVLGPGSDDYHDDHLHFDTIARSGGYRLCQ